MPVWLREVSDGLILTLHIQPGAKKTEIAGLHGGALKIRLAAPPVDGKANDCLLGFLSKKLGLPRAQVALVGGASSRQKRVKVDGVSAGAVAAKLAA